MTDILGQEKPDLNELAHHGVLGMKWGVRRGNLDSRVHGAVDDSFQRRIASSNAIATGNAKGRDRWRSATTTPTGIIPSKRIAARRVRVLNDRRERFAMGQATVGDVLSAVGHTSAKDLFVSRTDKRGTGSGAIHASRIKAGHEFTTAPQHKAVMKTKLSDADAQRKARAKATRAEAGLTPTKVATKAALIGAGSYGLAKVATKAITG